MLFTQGLASRYTPERCFGLRAGRVREGISRQHGLPDGPTDVTGVSRDKTSSFPRS